MELIIILIVLVGIPSFLVGKWAENWGHSFVTFFVFSLLFTWIIMSIALLALGKSEDMKRRSF